LHTVLGREYGMLMRRLAFAGIDPDECQTLDVIWYERCSNKSRYNEPHSHNR